MKFSNIWRNFFDKTPHFLLLQAWGGDFKLVYIGHLRWDELGFAEFVPKVGCHAPAVTPDGKVCLKLGFIGMFEISVVGTDVLGGPDNVNGYHGPSGTDS